MKRNQTQESVLGKELTQADREVFALVGESGSVPVDDLKTRLSEVRNLIGKRLLILVVLQRDWGVEFNLQQLGAVPQSGSSGGSQTE